MTTHFHKHILVITILAVLLITTAIFCISGLLLRSTNSSQLNVAPSSISLYVTPPNTYLSPSQVVQATDNNPLPAAPATPVENTTSSEAVILTPRSVAPSGLITNGDRTELKIALTFDVCQREGDLAGFDTEIIRVLNETQTPATFFLGGQWIRDHPQEAQQLASNPLFELGNHSWSHLDFSAITRDEMNSEVLLAQQEMNKMGYQTNLFRLPYGTYTDEALQVIAENGLYVIQWDVVSGDPDPNIDAERMTNGVLQQVQPGSIIIMHANQRGWHTAEALPGIIQSLRQQGYEIVTIPDLLRIPSAR